MAHITYIESSGTRHETEGETGSTVMETAIMHGVPGIVAELSLIHISEPTRPY